jgi:hypothetical protein
MRRHSYAALLAAASMSMPMMFSAPPSVEIAATGNSARSDAPQRSASAAAQDRTKSGRAGYTPMSQAARNRLPNFKLARAQRSRDHGPGTRQRRRRLKERRTRGGSR